jgi:glycosyltransferase involved in cell wall biosynthesis
LLCEALTKRGHKVTVYAPKKELKDVKVHENGVTYNFVECRFGIFKTLYKDTKNSWEKRSVEAFTGDHRREPFDIILGQSSWALPLIRIKNEIGIKVVSVLHGSKIGEYQTQLRNVKSVRELALCIRDLPHVLRAFFVTQREFVQKSDKLIAVSNFVKNSIIEETFVPESKITVIHNGVDESKYPDDDKQYATKERKVKLIYIGRVIRAKGLFVLINSLEKITGRDWECTIAGDGNALGSLKTLITQKNMTEKVRFTGFMKYEDIITELYDSDIFVLPSLRKEGFPMTIVEAMFSGLPSVVTDIGGNSDAVVNGETGYLVDPGDEQELTSKLIELMDSPEKRQVFGKNARNRAHNEFTIDRMVDKYEQVFKEILK